MVKILAHHGRQSQVFDVTGRVHPWCDHVILGHHQHFLIHSAYSGCSYEELNAKNYKSLSTHFSTVFFVFQNAKNNNNNRKQKYCYQTEKWNIAKEFFYKIYIDIYTKEYVRKQNHFCGKEILIAKQHRFQSKAQFLFIIWLPDHSPWQMFEHRSSYLFTCKKIVIPYYLE